jgi:hypothetical protein
MCKNKSLILTFSLKEQGWLCKPNREFSQLSEWISVYLKFFPTCKGYIVRMKWENVTCLKEKEHTNILLRITCIV